MPNPTKAGVTLAELLIVIVLIGILATIAAPHVALSHHAVEAAGREVGTRMLVAQRLAIRRQHNVVVAINAAENWIRVHEDLNNDGDIDAGESVVVIRLTGNVEFGLGTATPRVAGVHRPPTGSNPISFAGTQDGLPAVTFLRSGSATEEGGFYITSRNATGPRPTDTRAIGIDRPTGRVTTHRYTGSEWVQDF